ncbi:MAG: glycogen/starch synthase, partial [Planctomycetota bacterium]
MRRTQLADVAGALTHSLHESGVNVHVFLPAGEGTATEELTDLQESCTVEVQDGRTKRSVRVSTGKYNGLVVHLFDEPDLFSGRHPYGNEEGPYADNWRRYAVFSRAVLESLPKLKFTPDVLHCTDWTAGLIPLLRKLEYEGREPVHPAAKAGTYMHVQNLAMQGSFEREVLPLIGLSHDLFIHVGGLEQGGKVNFLKAGIEFSTIVGLGSPSMAEHVVELDRGYGLEESFERRGREVIGITNGIDYAAWDPAKDPLLPHTYSTEDTELAGKRRCKAALQSSLTLDNGPRTPVVAVLG